MSNHKSGERVSSLRDVIAACNLFLVRKLLVSENLHEPGFVYKGHHYVSLEPGTCPFDGVKLLSVGNVVDEIEQRQDLLASTAGSQRSCIRA